MVFALGRIPRVSVRSQRTTADHTETLSGGVSRVSHGHTLEFETRFDVTQGKLFEKLGRRYVDEILMNFR